MQWWGYRHVNGGIHLKRYIGAHRADAMEDAELSPFVDDTFGPFAAQDREAASAILKAALDPEAAVQAPIGGSEDAPVSE